MFHVPEKCRVKSGPFRSDESYGNNGMFTVKRAVGSRVLLCVASDGMEWEHVSVSLDNRCPTWDEMCHIKGIFWDSDDLVVQMHPPKSDYVNRHKFCLHLWRKAGTNDFCERPPTIMI